jgi:tRNA pseudouridine55 synthase
MEASEKCGVVIVNKEEGLTSQAVVNRIKRIFGVKKAGHTGTLDPLATGVLPVLIGRGVKASEFLLTKDKHYIATLLLGVETDTEDITGSVIAKSEEIPSEEAVMKAVSSMIGKSVQTPPMYSAIKIGGKKLCDLAREGVVIEREGREIEVFSIEAKKINELEYSLNIHCSKGTYVRTLCSDIGRRLGTYGCMKALQRSEVSGFTLKDAKTLSELENMSEQARDLSIIPIEEIFYDFKKITLPPFFARLARCGQPIYAKKLCLHIEVGERVKFYDENGFFAIGEAMLFDGEIAIKPIRQFDV